MSANTDAWTCCVCGEKRVVPDLVVEHEDAIHRGGGDECCHGELRRRRPAGPVRPQHDRSATPAPQHRTTRY